MTLAATFERHAAPIRWVSAAAILAGLVVIGLALPVDRLVQASRSWVESAGTWGAIAFGGIYVLAALLFVPGSALTIAAGALFGLWLGTAIVSLASTTAAALAFLIARHVARGSVTHLARRYPRFGALDRAIGKRDWKLIALLRLSPVVPFSAGNYLFGLTAARFVPYVLVSWVAMLPGTFLYVYLGHAGLAGIGAASGDDSRSAGQWLLLGVGLAATVALVIWVTVLARRAIGENTDTKRPSPAHVRGDHAKASHGRGALAMAIAAVLVLAGAALVTANKERLGGFAGPPRVTLDERHAGATGVAFDHSAFDALLRAHVDDAGGVDYDGLARAAAELQAYRDQLARADFEALSRDEKLALLINAYNAFTLALIVDHLPLRSIKDIQAGERWDGRKWRIGAHEWTLNEIEHEQLRPKFEEPRLHFAVNCASIGCPPLRPFAYRGDRIGEQLEAQARFVHGRARWFRFDEPRNVVHLTRIYDWYGDDFRQVAGSVLAFAARYDAALARALAAGKSPSIEWLDYDWSLNTRTGTAAAGAAPAGTAAPAAARR